MASAVVVASHLGQRYGSFAALADVSFELEGPGLFGVLGPNGAGKTTLLDLLEGLASPTSGVVSLFGNTVTPKRYPRSRVGVVLQQEFVPDHMTAGDYAELFAALFGVRGGGRSILARARLDERARQRVSRLSGGEAQRLFIAAALVHEPELLFLDEPTAELDPQSKREVGQLLRELSRERTVVMTTHDLGEADALCDYCLLLTGGAIRAQGPKRELLSRTPGGKTMADAFFHFCAARVTRKGELE